MKKSEPEIAVFLDRKQIDPLSSSKHNTLVLLLPCLYLDKDPLLDEMKLYLQNNPHLKHESPVSQFVRNVPDKNLLHDRVIEFIQFSGKNANSFTDYVVCFDENADAG